MFYTGVGSRDVTPDEYALMSVISQRLACRGWTLRSGGADGADSAFEEGVVQAHGKKEIYIPWQGFNGRKSYHDVIIGNHLYSWNAAKEMASTIHPAWDLLSIGAQSLHARNCYQVLGEKLDKPSTFLIACSDPVGNSVKGGTRTAWELAKRHHIQCFNLRVGRDKERIIRWIDKQ